MDRRSLFATVALLALAVSVASRAETHRLVVNGENLEFVQAPERGYVVKLAERTGSVTALSDISTLDLKNAAPVGGLDRRGVWIIANEGPTSRNPASIRSLATGGQVAYAAPLFSSNGETVAIIPEIVVRAKPGVEMEEVQTLCETTGCTVRKLMEFTTQEYLIEVLGTDADAVFAAVEALSRNPEVEWACPNTAFQPRLAGQTTLGHGTAPLSPMASSAGDPNTLGVFPNDEYFPHQWHLHNTGQSGGTPNADINAPEAWEVTSGDPNIIIAVLDAGVDGSHPDLVNNLVPGYDFYDDDDSPDPAPNHWMNAHGTCCAGLIAAQGNNNIGVSGVAWNCKIMPIRIFRADSQGWWNHITQADIATAFRWAASHGADTLSNSWGGWKSDRIYHSAIKDITETGGIGRAGKGCVVLFAAMNDTGPIRDDYPQCYPEVITVGATDHNDVRCWYSDFGPELDVMAPSGWQMTDENWIKSSGRGALWTTDIVGSAGQSELHEWVGIDPEMLDYTLFDGNSASCPLVAGVAALILSVEPDLTNEEVRHFLTRSAKDLGDPGKDDYYGWGRVDARAALDMVLAKRADLNDDWTVDLDDLVILIESWETDDVLADIAPATKRDGIVDDQDLGLLMRYWAVEIPPMDPPVD